MRQELSTVLASHPDHPDAIAKTAYAAQAQALGEVMRLWNAGMMPPKTPGMEPHVEQVRVVGEDGKWKGYRFYLVWNEPMRLGKMREEPEKV